MIPLFQKNRFCDAWLLTFDFKLYINLMLGHLDIIDTIIKV